MAPNPFFSGRIPQHLFNAIEQHRNTTGESKTEVLINALAAYLRQPVKPSTIDKGAEDRLGTIEKRLTLVEERLSSLPKTQSVHQLPLDYEGIARDEHDNTIAKNYVFIGKMSSKEIPSLPGLESLNAEKLKQKLRNARQNKSKETEIDKYRFRFAEYGELSANHTTRELVWDVYEKSPAASTNGN